MTFNLPYGMFYNHFKRSENTNETTGRQTMIDYCTAFFKVSPQLQSVYKG